MSAEWFETEVLKSQYPTAEAAFEEAVRQAQWDYGHAGYTGTIAEKDSFVMLADGVQPEDFEVNHQDDRIDSKWGPAGCYETERYWVFLGWASS